MAYEKLQGRRAIDVYPADDIKIPSPSSIKLSGTNTSVTPNQLVDAAADFSNVRSGDIVYNDTTGAVALVQNVSATSLTLSADIFTATPNTYRVFGGKDTDGPVLYVGTGGDLTILTVGKDEVTFTNLANGSFIPIMVYGVQATGTTCSDIIAIW